MIWKSETRGVIKAQELGCQQVPKRMPSRSNGVYLIATVPAITPCGDINHWLASLTEIFARKRGTMYSLSTGGALKRIAGFENKNYKWLQKVLTADFPPPPFFFTLYSRWYPSLTCRTRYYLTFLLLSKRLLTIITYV